MFGSFLSPIHEYTDMPFRLMCRRHGADAAVVPLVSATAIARDNSKAGMIDANPEEKNIGVQLVGSNPDEMKIACSAVEKRFPFVSWYDINCGCPSERTVECGGGSAMLNYPEKICETVKKMKDVGKPVSVKMRIMGSEKTLELCKSIEKAGADFIVVHGRNPGQGYSGRADWEMIKKIKQNVGIPVTGNGDIRSASQGNEMVRKGFCDSFMVGRAAMANPLLFEDKEAKTFEEKLALLDEYLGIRREFIGEPELKDVRIKAVHFMSGVRNAAALRDGIMRAKSVDEIEKNLEQKQ